MHEYETIYLLKPDLPTSQVKTLKEKFAQIITKADGRILAHSDWGKRKLAYDVQKLRYGQYLYLQFLAEGELISELERILKYEDQVMKFLTVKLAHKVNVEKRLAAAGKEVDAPKGLEEARSTRAAPVRPKAPEPVKAKESKPVAPVRPKAPEPAKAKEVTPKETKPVADAKVEEKKAVEPTVAAVKSPTEEAQKSAEEDPNETSQD